MEVQGEERRLAAQSTEHGNSFMICFHLIFRPYDGVCMLSKGAPFCPNPPSKLLGKHAKTLAYHEHDGDNTHYLW